MATYKPRRDERFYSATIAALKDIEERALQFPLEEHYAAAYGILRGYFEALLVNFAETFSEQQLAEIRIVLDQLEKVTGEDSHLDETTKSSRDQLAQALREQEAAFDRRAVEVQAKADLAAIETDEQAVAFIQKYFSGELRHDYLRLYHSDRHEMGRTPKQAIEHLLLLPPP